ncbi:MAG: PilZ domain-containing protein [Alphaproteobacteria bacterium]
MVTLGHKLKGFKREDKRRHRRTPARLPALVMDRPAIVTDISLGGFGFSCDDLSLGIGSPVAARIRIDERTQLEVEGTVAHTEILMGSRHFGVQFEPLSQSAFRAIERYQASRLRRRRPR